MAQPQIGTYTGLVNFDVYNPGNQFFANRGLGAMTPTPNHKGVDYGTHGVVGVKVPAGIGGIVTIRSNSSGFGMSVTVISDMPDGSVITMTYGHVKALNGLQNGDRVIAGQFIGTVENASTLMSGGGTLTIAPNSFLPHLHLEIKKNGQLQDPYLFNDWQGKAHTIGVNSSGQAIISQSQSDGITSVFTQTTSGSIVNKIYFGTNQGSTWTVGAGATGELIAAANGITLVQLQAANPGVNVANPPVGTVLNLPTVQNGLLVSTTTQAPNFNVTTTAPSSQTPFNVDNNTLIYTALGKVLGLGNVNTASGSYAFINDIISDYFRPGNHNLSPNQLLGLGIGPIDTNSLVTQVNLNANAINNASTGLAKFTPTDPLVLDLNGDGVRLSNYRDAPVLFDIDHDSGGTKEQTGWVSAQDGIVVYDRNNNSKIDDISETLSEYFGGAIGSNGSAGTKPYANGLAALKSLDSNNDNQFTAADAQWANVKVWVDANHDGITDAGELKTLASLGITSFNLTQTAQSGLVSDGNEILASSTFVQNGQTKEAVAANFIANPNGSTFTASGTGTLTTTEGNVKSYTAGNSGEVVDVAQKGMNNAYGGSGNDTLIGDACNQSEWRVAA